MFNFNLKGLADWFKLGKQGPRIKKDGDKVQFRNPDDSDFINAQALDPVDPQDVVTKQYLEDNSDLASFNLNGSLFKNFDYQESSPIQIGTQDIPSLALAYKVLVHVVTAFDGTTPTLEIGDSTTNDRLSQIDLSDLTEGQVFVVTLSDIFSADTTINAYLDSDSSTQGELDVTVLYTMSEETPVGGILESNLVITGKRTYKSNSSSLTPSNQIGQTYQHASDHSITSINLYMNLDTGPITGNAKIIVYQSDKVAVIGSSDTIDLTTLNSSLSDPLISDEIEFLFSSPVNGLLANTEYYFGIEFTSLSGVTTINPIRVAQTADDYANGNAWQGSIIATDLAFKINGTN